MIIRKIYEFENAHIVRFCSSKRCRTSIHGHSYKCEILLESNFLDNAGMIYDFGLMKLGIKLIVDAFDHAVTIFAGDDEAYKNSMKKYSSRWVQIPFNPSAEQFSRVFFLMIQRVLSLSNMENGEKNVTLKSIIIHETSSGYAQCFKDDVENENMGKFGFEDIVFSDEILCEIDRDGFYQNLLNNKKFKLNGSC